MTLLDLLLQDEDERQFPYDDATGETLKAGDMIEGRITIGVGRNLTDVGLSPVERRYLLQHDIERTQSEMDYYLPWWRQVDGPRQDVLTNMAFNMGAKKLLAFVNTLELVRQKHYTGAAEAMLQSAWAVQVGARATRLATIMRTGTI